MGFIFLDYILKTENIPFLPGKGDYYFNKVALAGAEVLLVKPVTFMNNSGLAVAQVVEHFDLAGDDFLIIYDDFHLPFGQIRFRTRGSAGGHNGIKSVIYHLQSEKFSRLKIGIGSPREQAVDYVLSDFSGAEAQKLDAVFALAYKGVQTWLKQGIQQAMNDFNGEQIDNLLN